MTTLTETAELAFTNFAAGWLPDQKPQDGDTLIVNTGTVVQIGERLPDTTLTLGFAFDSSTQSYLPTPTFDMIGGEMGTVDVSTQTPDSAGSHINVFGHAQIDDLTLGITFAGDRATVNIGSFSRLTTTIHGGLRSVLQIDGGRGAVLDNAGDSTVNVAEITANVAGSGTWRDGTFGHMEFAGSVARGQTVELSSTAGLTIDNPDGFHASIVLEQGWGPGIGNPNIVLAGIQGDSWTYRNDVLTIRDAGKVVDRVHIRDVGSEAFQVFGAPSGITLVGNFGGEFPQQSSGTIAPFPAS